MKCIFRSRIKKISGKEENLCKDVDGSKQLSYWCTGTFICLACSSAQNVTPVTIFASHSFKSFQNRFMQSLFL